jgi:FAD dependent oxidoreductase
MCPAVEMEGTYRLEGSVEKYDCDVVIVGAGVAGASSLYHILQHVDASKRITIIDAGSAPGLGFDMPSTPRYSGSAVIIDHSENKNDCKSAGAGTSQDNRSNKIIKMMVQIFACSMESFIQHHGIEGAQTYLECTKQGLSMQKALAKRLESLILDEDKCSQNALIKERGSMYFAYQNDAVELRKEYDRFVSLSKDSSVLEDVEWFERKIGDAQIPCDVSSHSKGPTTNVFYGDTGQRQIVTNECPFCCGIYFPNDAIIDSSLYAKLLVKYAKEQIQHEEKDRVRVMMNSKVTQLRRTYTKQSVTNIGTIDGVGAVCIEGYDVRTKQSFEIRCRHVVVATGGLSVPEGCCVSDLAGIISSCYSYLAYVPMSKPMVWNMIDDIYQGNEDGASYNTGGRNSGSPNFFTWKFTHDWCFSDDHHIRVSGEDHFSALKESRYKERCSNLINWTYQQYSDDGSNGNKIVVAERTDEGERESTVYSEKTVPQQYGVYTETPDYAPLVGFIPSDDSVCYIVGCNAWGQTILSYSASLVPAILGYRPFTPFEDKAMKLLSIQRFKYSMSSRQSLK